MKKLSWLFVVCLAMFFAGCASTSTYDRTTVKPKGPGFSIKVEKGQTLWSISRKYGVDLDTLISVNELPHNAQIETGRSLFIPQKSSGLQTPSYSGSGSHEDFIWPARGRVISSYYELSGNVLNKGIDIKTEYGASVVASRSGKVMFVSENLKGFGKTVIIEHDGNFSTVYARIADIMVSAGQNVRQGETIAKVGISGKSSVPYLHFEIRKKNMAQNPNYYLPR